MAFRKNILALATKISLECGTYMGVTPTDPEYKILDPIVDDEMCAIAMYVKVSTSGTSTVRTIEEIAAKAGKSVEYCQAQIDKLSAAGIVRSKLKNGVDGYYYPIWVPGIMEGVLSNNEQCEKYPVLAECFECYTKYRTPLLITNLNVGMGPMRVMPVGEAIKNDTRSATYDELSYLIEKADDISVGPCSCRRTRRLMGEGCGHLEEDMCMYLNDNARFFSKDGRHRLISKEEAYEILRRAEDNGLVHEINVSEGYEDTTAICNCCGCSCFALRLGEYFNDPDILRTNYVAKVDKEKCVACGLCVENCQMGALKLGTKLCSTEPYKPAPERDKPGDTLWTKDNYNVDYRTNRKMIADTGTAPCKTACPAHIPVQGYIKLASQGRYLEALELIKHENPFPAVCGRICNRRCEDACTRGSVDDPIAIDDIKKFIADKELEADARFIPAMLNQTGKPYPEKIAIIGGGPSGLSCAYYLAIKGYPVTVFEKNDKVGGMLTEVLPSFRLEKNVVEAEIEVLRELGVEFKCGVEVGKDVTIPALREEGYKAFYLAVGAWKSSALRCEGDDKKGVFGGIDFLYKVNSGKKPAIGKKVAVVGGGNTAMDVARAAVRMGAEKVYVIYRRTRDEMPASEEEYKTAVDEGIEFKFLRAPIKVLGDKKVAGIELRVMELAAIADEGGRRHTIPVMSESETVEVDSIIAAVGQKVDMGGILTDCPVEVNRNGTVKVDPVTLQTSVADVFAGGDVVTGPKFVIDAIAAGKEAFVSIHRFVHEGQSLVIGRVKKDYLAIDPDEMIIAGFDTTPRQKAKNAPAAEAVKTFKDLRGTLTEKQMKKETERCLGCGATIVDEYMCIGCGVCTTKCRFDAIKLERVRDMKPLEYSKMMPTVIGNMAKRVTKIAVKSISKVGK